MKPVSRRLLATAALSATALSLVSSAAEAIVVARVTRHGYILTDDPAEPIYGENLPVTNTREMYTFIYEATNALNDLEGFHQGRYLATMQLPSTQQPLAFYLPIRNDVRGIGQRSSTDTRAEVFDINRSLSTAFPLDGFLYLNSLRFYTDPRSINFGRYLICTQEFGHRYGPRLEITPYPLGAPDAGADASAPDDAMTMSVDASLADDAPALADAPVVADDAPALADASALADARSDGAVDAPPPGPLSRDTLLGRGNEINGMTVNRAHWSYFFNTGGSPMEGNFWTEIAPGEFRTERPSFRFSDFDLYNMGLVPASAVRPTFLIAEPTMLPRGVDRDSSPEYSGRTVTVRGRRVGVSIDDVIAANGRRVPAYPDTPRDLDVVWVLWVQPDQVDDDLAAEFDQAIESCALGYDTASGNLSRLVATTPYVPPPDAGVTPDAGPAPDAGAITDTGFVTDAGDPPDVPVVDDAADPVAPRAAGGCACST
ncbi:MAG: hypothetical protein Q8S73_15150, partial [Deltaproteobacteria bacterium]|nr:hypothetical protein [Deltaproteobacteria bacterium]